MLKRKHDNDVIEMLTADEKEAFSEKKTIKKYIEEKLSSTEKARKIYRKKILKHKDFYMPDNFDTACDIKEEIDHQEKYDISELTARYEKIRYTAYKPDKKYLNEMEQFN